MRATCARRVTISDLAIDGAGFFRSPDRTAPSCIPATAHSNGTTWAIRDRRRRPTHPVITIPSGAPRSISARMGPSPVLLPGVTQASQVGQIQLVRF